LRQGDGRERSQQDRREHAPATKTIFAQGFHGLFRFRIHSLLREHVKDIRRLATLEGRRGRKKRSSSHDAPTCVLWYSPQKWPTNREASW
jgi:hypothetical protein